MEDSVVIEVAYEGVKYSFEASLAAVGYTHQFRVTINGIEVIYEPDEERNYRAILTHADAASIKETDRQLMRLVGEKIQSIRDSG